MWYNTSMAKQLTCALVIINEFDEILMGKVTGQPFYDLPKGRTEPGETPEQTMVREVFEEFGYVVDVDLVSDMGEYPYNREKRIHVFFQEVNKSDIDLGQLKCISFFEHHATKVLTPEIDGYAWIPYDKIQQNCSASMIVLLTQRCDLRMNTGNEE